MKRHTVLACALALCCALCGCSGAPGQSDSSESSADASVAESAEQSQNQSEESAAIDYSTGIHHAELRIEGYNTPIELEIYSDSAPRTSEKFCELAKEGYYDGKTINWILDGLYVRMGSVKQDDDTLVKGEFEESDTDNSNSLRTGWVALARAEDGQQSDASSLIFFLSDASYLDGKYAGFAKVTDGLDVLRSVAARTAEETPADQRIEVSSSGKISKKAQRPKIESMKMVNEDEDND